MECVLTTIWPFERSARRMKYSVCRGFTGPSQNVEQFHFTTDITVHAGLFDGPEAGLVFH